MKRIFLASAISVLAVGCATERERVHHREDGTPVYGLSEQPQSTATGEGTVMRGAYGKEPSTGQFTGQERTQTQVGQYPVPPREADTRDLAHKPQLEDATSTGAGSLGQVGIQPGKPVTSGSIMSTPTNPSLTPSGGVNPPTTASAPTLAEPLTRGSNVDSSSALGSGPGTVSGQASSDNTRLPNLPTEPAPTLNPLPNRVGALNSSVNDLAGKVREMLSTGRPGTITALTPDRLENMEIEAVNGNVTLRGDVRSETEKVMLGNKVSRIEGVQSVNNQLRVVSPTRQGLTDPASPAERADPLYPEK